MQCRFCDAKLTNVLIDLVNSPASNSFLSAEQLDEPEVFYPLKVYVCGSCFLVQIAEYKKSSEIFNGGYVYFSSYSRSWLEHARRYTEAMIDRFGLGAQSQVIELASNDGYLLQFFQARGVPVLGVEPTANTAAVAREKGIETVVDFFGVRLATELQHRKANLLLGNNVLAHVPDLVDFVAAMKLMLAEGGVITMEFPHLVQLMNNNQFDTIYHEHFSYLSLYFATQLFTAQGLEIFDVDEIPTHGGSLRIYAKHQGDPTHPVSGNVQALLDQELAAGIDDLATYDGFQQKALGVKLAFLQFLLEQHAAGKTVVGYGAAAKGNTLLNYCGVKHDLVKYVVDANPHKQNMWLPGSHIPVVAESVLRADRPDFVVIFPWNIRDEVMRQLDYIREWGGRFVVPLPHLSVLEPSAVRQG